MLRSLSPLVLLWLAAAPAAAAQTPKLLPGDTGLGQAGGVQEFPAIAAGAGSHLAAWSDHRAGFQTLTTGAGTHDVFALRLGADGQPLDALPFRVSAGPGRKEKVRVAFDGTNWLVTWKQNSKTAFDDAAELMGARVDASGQVLDDPPLSIRKYGFSSELHYGLGGHPGGFAVVVQGTSGGEADIEGWTVDAGGAVDKVSSQVIASTHLIIDYELAFDGTQYLLCWSDPGVLGRRFTTSLAPVGTAFAIASGSSAGEMSLASDGSGWMVSWTDGSAGYAIRYRDVGPTGALGPIRSAIAGAIDPQTVSSIAWNGAGYTLAWTSGYFETTELRYARLAADGTLLAPGAIALGHGVAPHWPIVSSIGDGNAQVVWMDKLATPAHRGDVSGARITPTQVDAPVAVSFGRPRQGDYDLAAGGEGYLAVWQSERDGSIEILAQRLDLAGDALDPEPIELASGATLGNARAAWNGSLFLIVWHDEGHLGFPSWEADDLVLGQRMDAAGNLLDPQPFPILEGGLPDVAGAGGDFLVVARFAHSTEIFHIHGARVDGASGAVLDATPLEIGGSFARWPHVDSFGDRWVVAWHRNATHDSPITSALARVVGTDGSMQPVITHGGGSLPAVGASPDVALMVYQAGGELYGQRIADSGAALGGSFLLVSAPEAQLAPSVAWNGTAFVLAWEDRRNVEAFFDERHDVFAMRVAEDGTPLDPPGGFPVATSPDHDQMPVVAGRDGSDLIGFGLYLPQAPWAAVRLALVPGEGGCEAQNYCVTSPNSVGSGARMDHLGSTSVSANDLVLRADHAVPGQFGIFYYGPTQTQLAFGNGFRCVSGGIFRFPTTLIGVAGTALRAVDMTQPPAAGGQITPGSSWNFQFWYRDPAAGGAAFNLSDGLAVTFCE